MWQRYLRAAKRLHPLIGDESPVPYTGNGDFLVACYGWGWCVTAENHRRREVMTGLDLWTEDDFNEVPSSTTKTERLSVAFLAHAEYIQQWCAEFDADLQVVQTSDDAHIDILIVDERYPEFAQQLSSCLSRHTEQPPIIFFIVNKGSEPDCVRAFAFGAYDYVHLPISGEALAARLRRVWRRYHDSSQLQNQLKESSSIAFQSMTLNAELGRILNYMEQCFSCQSFQQVAEQTFTILKEFGLSASLSIFHDSGIDYFSDDKEVYAIEKEVLETARSLARIYDFGARTTVNFKHVGILARNMPVNDPVRYGVLKDHLCFVANALESRVAAMILDRRANDRARRIDTTVIILQQIIGEMENAKLLLTEQSSDALESMLVTLTSEFSQLSLTGAEETRLVELLSRAGDEVHALFRQATERDKTFRSLLSQLTETLKR